jgi:hypothetical protein
MTRGERAVFLGFYNKEIEEQQNASQSNSRSR